MRSTPSKAARDKRIKLAAFLGLPTEVHEDDEQWCFFDGKIMHFSTSTKMIDVDHEIGHFLAANSREKTRWEWGLGTGPSHPSDEAIQKFGLKSKLHADRPDEPFNKHYDYRAAKESKASLWGIAVTYIVGTKNEWRDHADQHTWENPHTSCDLFCLIRNTEHFKLKNGLTRLLKQLEGFSCSGMDFQTP